MQNNLAQLLRTIGLTQSALAEKIGIDPATMSRIVSGKRHPPIDLAGRITSILRQKLRYITIEDIWDCGDEAQAAKNSHRANHLQPESIQVEDEVDNAR